MHTAIPGTYHSGFHGCVNCGHAHPHYSYPYGVYFYPHYGIRYRYPYYGYGYYWPWSWDNSSSYSDDDSTSQREAARQIDDLNQQVQQLRNRLEESQSAQYQNIAPVRARTEIESNAPAQSKAEKYKAQPDLATVLVFRDQKIQEVKNYAIVGKTLVVIADERQHKIPLTDLDLDATAKLNAERGVDFQLPR